MEYKVGDEVWYAPPGYDIIIKCKITEVDDEFRKKEPQAYLFYDIDEPVGHSLAEYELLPGENEENADEFHEEIIDRLKTSFKKTLEDYRREKINFIVRTHQHRTEEENIAHRNELIMACPTKLYGEDWFYL